MSYNYGDNLEPNEFKVIKVYNGFKTRMIITKNAEGILRSFACNTKEAEEYRAIYISMGMKEVP